MQPARLRIAGASATARNERSHAVSNKSCSRRTADQHHRRRSATGAGLGIAVGGAMAAAFVSMGTASADNVLATPTDDGTGYEALPTAAATGDPLDSFEQLVQAWDGNAFTAAGAPNDWIGTIASEIDSGLASTVFGPELNTIAGQILAADFSAAATTDDDGFTDLAQAFDPFAFNAAGDPTDSIGTTASQLDTLLAPTVYGPEIDTIADQIIAAFTTTTF